MCDATQTFISSSRDFTLETIYIQTNTVQSKGRLLTCSHSFSLNLTRTHIQTYARQLYRISFIYILILVHNACKHLSTARSSKFRCRFTESTTKIQKYSDTQSLFYSESHLLFRLYTYGIRVCVYMCLPAIS